MTTLAPIRPESVFQRLSDWLDVSEPRLRLLNGYPEMIRIEESLKDETLTIKAEIPGINPETDVDISLTNGVLTISGERTEKAEQKEGTTTVSEFRYGSFSRSVAVPKNVQVEAIKASYCDGILTVAVPMPPSEAPTTKKISITRD
jgi:HSP20 family protein